VELVSLLVDLEFSFLKDKASLYLVAVDSTQGPVPQPFKEEALYDLCTVRFKLKWLSLILHEDAKPQEALLK